MDPGAGTKVLYNNPFEAVAHGALRLAASHPFEDILQHSYVLEVMSRTHTELAVYDYLPIVKSGTLYPLVEPVELETFLKPNGGRRNQNRFCDRRNGAGQKILASAKSSMHMDG